MTLVASTLTNSPQAVILSPYRNEILKFERECVMSKPESRMEGPMILPRAFALLRLLAEQRQGLTLSCMAANLEMPKSSLSSALKALTDQGFLTRKGTLYFLGPEAYGLASTILAGRTIRQIARPYLEQTMESTGETVLLAQLDSDGKYASYIDSVESDKSIRFSVPLAARRALYCSAAGRVFMAFMSERSRSAYFDGAALERLTDTTETDRVELEKIATQIRETGISITMGDYSADAAGFAAPIFSADGDVAGVLSIGVPVSRAQRDETKYRDAAIKAAADISKVLGFSRGGKS